MKPHSFYEKLAATQHERGSTYALLLAPKVSRMPLPIARFDDPFLPFGKAIIDATRDLICGYVFDLAAYLALGAAGAVALERTIAYAGADGVTITILHAPFASVRYVEAVSDRAFHVDAVTITHASLAPAYQAEQGMEAFVVIDAAMIALEQCCMFIQNENRFVLPDENQPLRINLLDELVLFAGSGDDFAAQVRAAVSEQGKQ